MQQCFGTKVVLRSNFKLYPTPISIFLNYVYITDAFWFSTLSIYSLIY